MMKKVFPQPFSCVCFSHLAIMSTCWNATKDNCYSQSVLISKMQLKVMAWAGSEISISSAVENMVTRKATSESSQSRDIKNNGIKEGLFVYPELPEYTASLTSLRVLVAELTRSGSAQLKNPLQTRQPRAKNAHSFSMLQ